MIGFSKHLTTITLNVNGLNSPFKRHRLAYWIKKQKATKYCLQDPDKFPPKGNTQTERERIKSDIPFNQRQKPSKNKYLIFRYNRLQVKTDQKTQGWSLPTGNGNNSTETTTTHIYAPNVSAPNFIKQN